MCKEEEKKKVVKTVYSSSPEQNNNHVDFMKQNQLKLTYMFGSYGNT